MLGEADLVGVFGVGVVRVDRLGPVRVFGRLRYLAGVLASGNIGSRWLIGTRAGGGSEARLGRVALRARRSAGVSGKRGRGLEATQLSRSVHLRGVAGGHGLGTSTKSTGHRAAVAVRAGLLLVQSERINKPAVRRLGRRAKVEDPDDGCHGEENKAGSGGLLGAMGTVDQSVGTERGQDQTTAQVSHNGDAIDMAGIGGKGDNQSHNHTEHITDSPPGEVRVVLLDVGDDGGDECDKPCQDGDGEGR